MKTAFRLELNCLDGIDNYLTLQLFIYKIMDIIAFNGQ